MLFYLPTLFILTIAGIYGVVILYLSWYFNYWNKQRIVGPKPQLLYGTFPKSSAGECNLIEELHEIYLQYKYDHKYVGVFKARNPKLFILDPKLATQILTQNFTNFHDNESSQWTTPNIEQMRICSPFVTTGDQWKERRLELVPTLTANRLRAFYDIMLVSADKLVHFIERTNTDKPLNVKELANRYTCEFISNFIWGLEANSFANATKHSPIHQMAKTMMSQSLECIRYYGRTANWPWLRKIRPKRFFPATSDAFFQQLFTQALQLSSQRDRERGDVIDHLLQLKTRKHLSDVQIAGHTTTVLIDGFETGAVVIAHCLLLLSRNELVQQKLRDILLLAGDNLNFDELMELPYLDQCIQETLRIFPPLATLFKQCTTKVTIRTNDNTEFTLNPTDVVYISSYSFHHDPDYYENPHVFWPERFDDQMGGVRKYRDMGVFLPFGDGPRVCPGMKLALAEVKVAVAKVIRHFHLTVSPATRNDNKIASDSFLLTLDGEIDIIFKNLHMVDG